MDRLVWEEGWGKWFRIGLWAALLAAVFSWRMAGRAWAAEEGPGIMAAAGNTGVLIPKAPSEEVYQEEENLGETIQELGIGDEIEDMQRFLDEVMGQGQEISGDFSFRGLMKEMAGGNLKGILAQIGAGIRNQLWSEVEQGGRLLAQVAAIGVIGAVFSNVSSVWKGGQISDTGFFVTYLLLFTCLAGSFLSSLQIASKVLGQILEFMRLLMPAYFMAVAFSGGSMSALALYEGMMAAVTAVQWMCSGILLTAVKMYVLVILGSHAVKEPFLSKAAELLEKGVGWSLKTLLGLVVGIQVLQSLILPYADGLKQTGMWRLVEMVPGLGQGAGVAAQMVLGAGVLLKNTIGGAAVVVLAVISLVPVMKLAVLMLLYHFVAAVMQPICDKRMVSCVSGVAKGHGLLLQIVLYSLFLFVLAVAVTCVSTNVGYLAH